ncbi:pyroglutamylated RF-amide peptide receptor-like [Physella acuta]|uniref:pyroglutamylated RF-amide peptide receptor-like n=1 Tax=Physella acuta TaxID=109671 RepID=UPI0027DEA2DD|nr:pyroglutamylated RF-amide peptide receptor-like [Physella acuta]
MVNYVQCQSMVCSVLTLTSISLERVIAVALPLKARTICTMRHAKLMVVIVWCLSFLLAIPTAVSVKHIEVGERFKAFWCVKEFSSFQFQAFYELYMLVLLFVVPMCVMIVTYTIIGVKVWRFTDMRADMRQGRVIAPTSKERIHQSMSNPESCLLSPHSNGEGRPSVRIERKKDLQEDTKTTKQLVLMLIIVVVLFALCWGPILINNVLVAFRHLPELHYGHLKHLRAAFNLMSYFNSCINPIVYAFMSKNFRQSFKFAICACLKGKAFVRAYRFSVSIASTRTSTISNGHLRRGISAHRDKSSSSGNENTHTHVVTDDDIVEMRSMTHPLV